MRTLKKKLTFVLICIGVSIFLIPQWANSNGMDWSWVQNSCHYFDEDDMVDCLVYDDCELILAGAEDRNIDQLKGMLTAFYQYETQCFFLTNVDQKAKIILQSFRIIEWLGGKGYAGDEIQLAYDQLCGGILNNEFTRVELSTEHLQMDIGQEIPVTAAIKNHYCAGGLGPACGCDENSDCNGYSCMEDTLLGKLNWEDGDKEVAIVKSVSKDDRSAVIKAIGEGTTYILVANPAITKIGFDPLMAVLAVTVGCDLSWAEISLNSTTANLDIGESKQITASKVGPDCLSEDMVWRSDNPSIATTDQTGKITGVSEGSTAVYVEYKDAPDIYNVVQVTVAGACNDEAFIHVQPVFTCVDAGAQITLSATVMVWDPDVGAYEPSDCHGTDIVWGKLPWVDRGAMSINCETGVVTGLVDTGYNEHFGAYLRDKPWIWGQGMMGIAPWPFYSCPAPGEELCTIPNPTGPPYDHCVDSWEWPSCMGSLSCSQRSMNVNAWMCE